MLGEDGRELPNRQVVLLPALSGRSGQDPSLVPLLQEQTGVIYPSLLNQSGVPFAVRLLPAPRPRTFLLPMLAPLPVPSPRRPFEVPLGSDAERGVPVTVRLLSKIAKVNPL